MTTQPNTTCTCPTGDGSLRWPCPVHTPAGSREAAMVVIQRDAEGRPTVWCDPEIADLVKALNAGGIPTVASCSGHGEQNGIISLRDGRELIIAGDYDSARHYERAIAAQPAAAQEAVAWQWRSLRANTGWKDCTRAVYDVFRQNGLHYEVRKLYAAPVTAAPADLIERCKEILAWQRTGVLPGDALRAYANARWPDEHDPLQIAEKETAREAFRILARAAAASTPAAPGIDLAADYDGMRVDHSGLFKQVRAALRDEPGLAEMVRQLHGHLVALGRRWYAGDKKVVEELLQLYCIEPDARRALIDASPKDELESWKRGTKACAEVLGQVMRQTQDSPKGGSEARAPLGLKLPNLPFAVFDEFGVGADDRIADYGLACAKAAMQAASAQAQASDAPTYTTGHCENHKKPGGCPLHNLQCGYPRCDRRQAGDAEVQP